MQIKIANCNNIDSGTVGIDEKRLNIKYAMNGTGKSTIAKAIELCLKNDGSIKELTPFKLVGATDEATHPKVEGLGSISTIEIFNDSYISQFVFQPEEILANSFEIFIKTPEYAKHLEEIEKLIAKIKHVFQDLKEIDSTIADLTTLSESFGTAKSGYSAAGAIGKSFGKGNKVANIPKGLESYGEYLKSSVNAKWIRWHMDGHTKFSQVSDKCPYCTTPIKHVSERIEQVGKEYDPKSIEHLNKVVAVLENLGMYFSLDANEKLHKVVENVDGLSPEQIGYLLGIKEQADRLRDRLLNLRGLTYFSMKDDDKVADYLKKLRIQLEFLPELNSDSTKDVVAKINSAIDEVLVKVGMLQGEVAQQTRLISKTIEDNKKSINDFLRSAGYKYYVDVESKNDTYRMRLKHADLAEAVSRGAQHLSYGEKNAFALVLFMYYCLSKNPDMIILDDPISSFDRNKKYAVIDMLFRGAKSFRGKTVLMMTHDLEPIVDMLYTLPGSFEPLPKATFVELKNGLITEIPITRDDLATFGSICDEVVGGDAADVVKITYLRRYYEISNNKGLEYELLSNLLHKRPEPFIKREAGNVPLSSEQISAASEIIKRKLSSFDYTALFNKLSDESYMIATYKAAKCNYEKLQIFRVLKESRGTSDDVINKFINETFHIENDYVMQINPCKYEIVPFFIIEECDRALKAN